MKRSEIEKLVEILKVHHVVSLEDIHQNSQAKKAYNKLKYIHSLIVEREDASLIRSIVQEKFQNVPQESIVPGTIGGWCIGCLIEDDPCTPLCCSALKLGLTQWSVCESSVVMGVEVDGEVLLKMFFKGKGNKVQVYLPMRRFKSLSSRNVSWLDQHNLTHGIIHIKRSEKWQRYREFSSLEEIAPKKQNLLSKHEDKSGTDYGFLLGVVLLIIIVLVILFYMNQRGR